MEKEPPHRQAKHLPVATHKHVKAKRIIEKEKKGTHPKWVTIKNNFGVLSRLDSLTHTNNANMKADQVDKHFFIKPRTFFCNMHGLKCACLDKWNGNLVQMELSTKSGSRKTEENQSDITSGDQTDRGATNRGACNNFASNGGNFRSPLCEKSKEVGKNPVKRHSSRVNVLQKDGFTKKYIPTGGTAADNGVTNAENTEKNPLSIFKTESDKILEHIKKWKMKRSTLSRRLHMPDHVVSREIPAPSAKEVTPNYANFLRDKKRERKKTDTCGTLSKKLESFTFGERVHCNYANGEKNDTPKNEAHIQGKETERGTSHAMETFYNNNKVKKSYLKNEGICFSQKGGYNLNHVDEFHIVSGLTMERKFNLPGGNCPRHKTPSDRSSCSVADRSIPANIPSSEGLYQNEQINQRKKRKIDTQTNTNALINRTNNCKELLRRLPALRLRDGSENDATHSSQIISNPVNCSYLSKRHSQDIAFKSDLKWKNYILTKKSADIKGSTESAKHSYDIYEGEGRKADTEEFATSPDNLNNAKNVIRMGTSEDVPRSAAKTLDSEERGIAKKIIQNEHRESQNVKSGDKKALTDRKVKFQLGKRNPHSPDEAAKATRRSNKTGYNDNSAITTEEKRGKYISRKSTTHMTHLGKTPESNFGKRPNHNTTLRNEKRTFAEANPTKRGIPNGSNNLPKTNMLTHSNRTKESGGLRRISQMASTCKKTGFNNHHIQPKTRERKNQSQMNKVKPRINDTAVQPFWDEKQKLDERKHARQPPSKAIQMDTNKNTKGTFSYKFEIASIYSQLRTNFNLHEGMTDGDSYACEQSKKISHEKPSPCSSGKTEYASSVSSPGQNSSDLNIMEEEKKETHSPKRPNYKSQESLLYELIHTNDNKSRIKQFIEQSEDRQNACTNLCSEDAPHRNGTTQANTNAVNVNTAWMNAPRAKIHNRAASDDQQNKSERSTSNGQKRHPRKSDETLLYELINANDNKLKILNFLNRSSRRESSPSQRSGSEGNCPKQNEHKNDRLGEKSVKIMPHVLEAPPSLSSHSGSTKPPATKSILLKWKSTRACKTVANKDAPKYKIPSKSHNKYATQNKIKALTTKMQSSKEMKQRASIKTSDKIRNGHKLMAIKRGETKLSDMQSRDAPRQVSSRNLLSRGTAKGKDTQRTQIITPKRADRDYLAFAKLKTGTTKHDIQRHHKGITIKPVHVKDKNESRKNIHSSTFTIKKQVDNGPTNRRHGEAMSKVPSPSHVQKGQSKMANHHRGATNQVKIKKCPITQQAIPSPTEQKTKGEVPEEQRNSKQVVEKTLQSEERQSVQDGTLKENHTKHKVCITTDRGERKRKLPSDAETNTRVKARKVKTVMIPKKISIQKMATNWGDKFEQNSQSATNEKGQRVNSPSDVKVAATKKTTPSVVNPLKKVNTKCIHHILQEKKKRIHFTNRKEEATFCAFNTDVQQNSSNQDVQMSFSLYVSTPGVNPSVGQHLFSAFSNKRYNLLATLHLNRVLPFDELKKKKLEKKQNRISHEGGHTYLSSAAEALTKMRTMLTIHFYQMEWINCVKKWTTMTVQHLEICHWSGKKSNLMVMHGQTIFLNKVEEVGGINQVKPHLANVDTTTDEKCKEPSKWLQAEVHSNHYAAGGIKDGDFNIGSRKWENKSPHTTIFKTDPRVKCIIKRIIMSRKEEEGEKTNQPIIWSHYLAAEGSRELTCTQRNIPNTSITAGSGEPVGGRHIRTWEHAIEGKNITFEESKRKIIAPSKLSVMDYRITALDMGNKVASDNVQAKKMCTNVAEGGNKYVLAKKENYQLGGVIPVVQKDTDVKITTQGGLTSVDDNKGRMTSACLTNRNLENPKKDLVTIKRITREGFSEGKGTLMIEDLKKGSQQMENGTLVQLPHTKDNIIRNQTTKPPNGDIEKEIFIIKQLIKEILTEMKNGLVKQAEPKKSKNPKREKSRLKEDNRNAGIKNFNKRGSKRKKGKDSSIEKVKERDINVTTLLTKMKRSSLKMESVINALENDSIMGISIEESVEASTREVTDVSDVSGDSEVLVAAELSGADDAMMLQRVPCRNDIIVGQTINNTGVPTMVEDVCSQDNVMLMESASGHIDVVGIGDASRKNYPLMMENVVSEDAPIMMEDIGIENALMIVEDASREILPKIVNTPSQTSPPPVHHQQREIQVSDSVNDLVSELEDYEPSSENKKDDVPCRDAKKEEIRQEIKKLIEMVKELKREYTKEMQKDCSQNVMEREKLMITYLDETKGRAQIIDVPFPEDGAILEDSPTAILTLQMKGEKTEEECQNKMIKDHEGEQSYQSDINKIATTLPEQINLKRKLESCDDLDNAKGDNATTHSSRPTFTKKKNRFNERVKLRLMMRQSLKMGNSNEAKMRERKEKQKLKRIIKDILNAETIRRFLNDQTAENDLEEESRKRTSPYLRTEAEYVNARGEADASAKSAAHEKAITRAEAATRAKKATYAHWPTKSVNPLGAKPPSPSGQISQLGEDICDKIDPLTLNDVCGERPAQGKETTKGEKQNENSSEKSERNEKIKKLMSRKRVTLNENLARKRAFSNAQKKANTENITDDFFC
ncbi:hypothetical protein C922_05308 [Plasmodium inui San Antonio 1]|uniref:Uncharacterized protein n=1 Tax=Plasmodium inui San Antonio 1 TaxID=1237626 RepID=W7AG75_9APIC|nr:hypothetical protein C922_05308 [Plasmodium inui San Antonio 1]EUD64316.1 hypothetical protein C922_05308 [Plasmodium inui San Antonio 1]